MRESALSRARGAAGGACLELVVVHAAVQVGTAAAWGGWDYFRSGALNFDVEFTRTYSRGLILNPRAEMMEREGAIVASWRAARCLETEGYAVWRRVRWGGR